MTLARGHVTKEQESLRCKQLANVHRRMGRGWLGDEIPIRVENFLFKDKRCIMFLQSF